VLVAPERPRDAPARPIVQEPLLQAGVVAAGQDHGDLRAPGHQLGDTAIEGSGHVAIPAFDQFERDGDPELHPAIDQLLLEVGVDRGVDGHHLLGSECEGVPDRTEDGSVGRQGLATEAFRWLPGPDGTLLFERGAGLRCAVNLSTRSIDLPPGARVVLASAHLDGDTLRPDGAAWFERPA